MAEVASVVTPANLFPETVLLELYTYLSAQSGETKSPVPTSFRQFKSKPREGREDRDVSWMMTDDNYRGFRPLPSPGQTRFWLCVSKDNHFDQKKRYDPPRGYEWAVTEMWNSSTVLSSSSDYNYYNQGGWSSYTFGGVVRHCFLFKDSVTAKRMIHAGNYATMGGLQSWDPLTSSSGYNFAGIVVIKKGTWDASQKQFKQ